MQFQNAMNIADILIVYLTLGAPFAVYKYLQKGPAPWPHKLLGSLATLTFWVPEAVRLARRHLTNAYSTYDFVSSAELDAGGTRLDEILSELESELATPGTSRRDVRDLLERYAALAATADGTFEQFGLKCAELLEVSGTELTRHGIASMVRHNRRKLHHHHIQARRELIRLLESIPEERRSDSKAFELSVELADLLNDEDALVWLNSIEEKERGRIWKPESHVLDEIPAPGRLATSSLTSD